MQYLKSLKCILTGLIIGALSIVALNSAGKVITIQILPNLESMVLPHE